MRMTTSIVVLLTLASGCSKRPLTKQMEDEAIRAALRTRLEAAESLALGDPWSPGDVPPPLENMVDEEDELAPVVLEQDGEELAIPVDPNSLDDAAPVAEASNSPSGWPNMAGGSTDAATQQSMNNLARAIDEQRMMATMEARLADKQRLMDQMYMEITGKAPAGALPPALPAAPVPPPVAPAQAQDAGVASVAAPAPDAPPSVLRLATHPEGFRVSGLGEDNPAMKTGLRNGDILTEIDEKDATKYKTSEALKLIEEMSSKPVTMTRDETRVTLAFTPEEKRKRDKKAKQDKNDETLDSLDDLKRALDAQRKEDNEASAKESAELTKFIAEEVKSINKRIDDIEDEQLELQELKENDRQRWNPFPKKAKTDPIDAGEVEEEADVDSVREERENDQMARFEALMAAQQKSNEEAMSAKEAEQQARLDALMEEQRRKSDEALAARLKELEDSRKSDGSERDAKLDEEIAALKAKLDERDAKEEKLQSEIDALKDAQHAKELALTEKIARLEGSLSANQASAQPDTGEADALNSELAALRAELKQSQAESAAKQAQDGEALAALQGEIASLRDGQSGSSAKVNNLFTEIDSLAAERAKLEKELESADAKRRAELEEERRRSDAKAAALQSELEMLKKAQGDLRAEYEADRNRLRARLEPLEASGVTVREVDGNVQVDMPSDVLFASGSATLSKAGRAAVKEVGSAIEPFETLKVQIQGHTDNVPIRGGKYSSNWDLAFARSRDVLTVLLDSGFPSDRISAASFGDSRPVATNNTSAGRTKNRRIEIVLEIPVEEK